MFSILIDDRIAARTPQHFGVNVEVQDHFADTNLWDWLADSGSTIIREFHPETCLRKKPLRPADLTAIHQKADFDRWRETLANNPDQLDWNAFAFSEPVPWLGVPDGIIGKLKQARLEPIVSMGYFPRMFSEPLLRRLSAEPLAPPASHYPPTSPPSPLALTEWDHMPSDADINWRAAAAAYEYYFAFLHHFTHRFGTRFFNLHNEPEFHYQHFHYPPVLMPDPPRFHQTCGPYLHCKTYFVPIAVQMAVLARIARIACEDVRRHLPDPALASALTLASPAWHGGWEFFWKLASEFVDICDYHQYGISPDALEHTHRRVANRVRHTPGKRTACTEYGRKAGPIGVRDLLFDIHPALESAALMMRTLSFTKPEDPPCAFAAFYQFQFPATHRNFKSLVYGDMNLLDWTGRDREPRQRGQALYPSFEALQLRNPTAAYHMFRMLARCTPQPDAASDTFPVLDCGFTRTSRTWYDALQVLTVRTDRDLIICLLNQGDCPVPLLEIRLDLFPGAYPFAVVRETSASRADAVIAQLAIEHDRIHLDLAPLSLTQIICTPLALDRIESFHLVEESFTPGNKDGLRLHETTRFRAMGTIDGIQHDLSQLNILWSSSDAETMPVHQGGLVVHLRKAPDMAPVSMLAQSLDHVAHAATTCLPR